MRDGEARPWRDRDLPSIQTVRSWRVRGGWIIVDLEARPDRFGSGACEITATAGPCVRWSDAQRPGGQGTEASARSASISDDLQPCRCRKKPWQRPLPPRATAGGPVTRAVPAGECRWRKMATADDGHDRHDHLELARGRRTRDHGVPASTSRCSAPATSPPPSNKRGRPRSQGLDRLARAEAASQKRRAIGGVARTAEQANR